MRFAKLTVLILILIGGCQCEDESTDPCVTNPFVCGLVTPVTVFVDVVSTSPQTGLAGANVADPPAVRVSLASGPAPACFVFFEVTQGNGLLQTAAALGSLANTAFSATDQNGNARVGAWQLGAAAGLNRVRVISVTCTSPLVPSVNIRSGTFDAMGEVPVPASITKVEGDQQTGTAGELLPIDPKALVRAQQNLPMPDAQVMFRVLSGGGSINGGPAHVATTDPTGRAVAPMWRLGALIGTGPNAGRNELEATVAGLAPVIFTAMSLAGAPLRVVAASVPVGGAGAAATPEPEVAVTDANDNPVPNASVMFEVIDGGGSVSAATQTTDAAGRARTAWTFGAQPGVLNRLNATVLRNNQPDPAVQGNPVTFAHTPPATGAICVYITIYGDPVANVAVTLTGPESRNGATDSDGVITFTNVTPGTYTVTMVPPAGTTFNPTSQQVTVAAGATPAVFFEGFGLSASSRPPAHKARRR